MNDLIVTDTVIRRDDAGRFCLNDLHKAAGGEDRLKPSNWLRLDSTKSLVEEIGFNCSESRFNCSDLSSKNSDDNTDPSAVILQSEGRYGGSYAVKLLAYAYAMWVSPAFQIKVIQAYERTVTGNVSSAPAPSQPDYFNAGDKVAALIARIRAEPGAEARQSLHALLTSACTRWSIPVPSLDELEATAPAMPSRRPRQYQPQVAAAFWQAVSKLDERKLNIDHSHDPGRVAYNLLQVRNLAEAAKVKLPASRRELRDALHAHPRFVGVMAVNSVISRRTVKCWVFARDGGS